MNENVFFVVFADTNGSLLRPSTADGVRMVARSANPSITLETEFFESLERAKVDKRFGACTILSGGIVIVDRTPCDTQSRIRFDHILDIINTLMNVRAGEMQSNEVAGNGTAGTLDSETTTISCPRKLKGPIRVNREQMRTFIYLPVTSDNMFVEAENQSVIFSLFPNVNLILV